jgi:hypothetical protein
MITPVPPWSADVRLQSRRQIIIDPAGADHRAPVWGQPAQHTEMVGEARSLRLGVA